MKDIEKVIITALYHIHDDNWLKDLPDGQIPNTKKIGHYLVSLELLNDVKADPGHYKKLLKIEPNDKGI